MKRPLSLAARMMLCGAWAITCIVWQSGWVWLLIGAWLTCGAIRLVSYGGPFKIWRQRQLYQNHAQPAYWWPAIGAAMTIVIVLVFWPMPKVETVLVEPQPEGGTSD